MMTGKGHLTAGTAMTAAALYQAGYVAVPHEFVIALGIGSIASLLPDMDSENATIRSMVKSGWRPRFAQALFPPSARRGASALLYLPLAGIELLIRFVVWSLMGVFATIVPHRGPTHYLATGLLLAALIWAISFALGAANAYALGFGVGYLSHLYCDSFTRSGVRLLGPVIQRPFHALPRLLRLRTERQMTISEAFTVTLLVLICALAFYLPPPIYLPFAAVLVAGMYILTFALDGRQRQPATQQYWE